MKLDMEGSEYRVIPQTTRPRRLAMAISIKRARQERKRGKCSPSTRYEYVRLVV